MYVCIVGEPVYLPPRRRLRRRSHCRAASPCTPLLFLLLAPLRNALCFCCSCTFVFLPSLWPCVLLLLLFCFLRGLFHSFLVFLLPLLFLPCPDNWLWEIFLTALCVSNVPTSHRRLPVQWSAIPAQCPTVPQHSVPPLLTHWWLCPSFTNWLSA